MLYEGPIIDAHTHLWDLRGDKYPWLRPTGSFGPKGRLDALKGKSYLLEDYRRDIVDTGVIASVHVEALWDPADGRINETRWLETLDSEDLASRYVIGVDFGTSTTEAELREQAAFSRVRGVRQTIAWTPDPNIRMVPEAHIVRGDAWRSTIPLLLELGLHLELLMYPDQGEDVADLAQAFPELTIVVNHIGSPIKQDPEGLQLWRQAVETMAGNANIFIKLSAAAAYPSEKSVDAMRPFVTRIVDSFGPERTMFGSDFPVGRLVGWTYTEYLDAYRHCLNELPHEALEAVFIGTASRVYGFTPVA